MKPLPYTSVGLSGAEEKYATVSGAGLPDHRTAPPADFDGPGDAWSPEHLLMAAVATCFMFTFRAVAGASKLKFGALRLSGEGMVDRREGVIRFTEIVLRPRLTLGQDADRDRAMRVLMKAEKTCLVSATLLSAIRLEQEIEVV